jgi:hypothetical protein
VPLQLREGSGRDKEISTIGTSTDGPPSLSLVVIESGLTIMDGCRSPKTLHCTYPTKRKAWPSRRSNREYLGHAPEAEGHEVKSSHKCRHQPTLVLPRRRSTLGIGKRGGLSNARVLGISRPVKSASHSLHLSPSCHRFYHHLTAFGHEMGVKNDTPVSPLSSTYAKPIWECGVQVSLFITICH